MLSFRNQLLQTFGITKEYVAIVNPEFQIKHSDDCEPFAEIRTDKSGKTTLRVGRLYTDKVPVITIRS